MTYPSVRVYIDFVTGAFAHAATWTEVTDWVMPTRMRYGRSSSSRDFEPGSGSLTLLNTDGRFDPLNASGPYFGNLLPRRRVKVEATIGEATYLIDPFASGPSGTRWSTVGSGGVVVSGGTLQVTSATTATTRGLQAVTAIPFYDLSVRADQVSMTATPWPASASFYPIYLRMDGGDTEAAWWEMTSVSIAAGWKQAGVTDFPFTATHSNTTHAYLRIRRIGHTTYWESSTDGSSWTVRAQRDIAWQFADTCTPRIVVTTTSSEGTTDTLTISNFDATYTATHGLGYGWVKGWPQSQDGRKYGTVDVEWSDALTILARTELPESVYDYRVRQLTPDAWYKLQDRLVPTLEDSSGNGNHGVWGTVEETQSLWNGLENRPLPAAVLKAGEADSVIPASGRPGLSWARMQSEIAQPLDGATHTPRAPVARTGTATQYSFADSFSVEVWFIHRQSFFIGPTNGPATATPVVQDQTVVRWGDDPHGLIVASSFHLWELGLGAQSSDFYAYFRTANPTNANMTVISTTAGVTNIDDRRPHQMVATWDATTVRFYVDGVLINSGAVNVVNTIPTSPATLGGAFNDSTSANNFNWHLQSLTGDVVFYGATLSAPQVEDLWYAGRYGTLDTTTRLTTGQVIDQALTMIGWAETTSIDADGHYVKPDVPKRAGALDYIRKAARSEQGAFYQAPDGTLTFLTSDWSATLDRAKAAHWRLSDDGSTVLGYSAGVELDFSDEALVNDMSVDWYDGEQHAEDATSITAYGRLRDSHDTILDTPEDALQLANWTIAVQGEPRWVVTRPIVIEPVDAVDFAFCCSVTFGSRVALTRTTPDGRTITEDYLVQEVSHGIAPGRMEWETQLTLEPADQPGELFTLNSSLATDGSLLNGPDVLAF